MSNINRKRSNSSLHLEPPRKSVELLDPGARELESSGDEEYYSDASEGRQKRSRPATPSSPIPRTRIEKVDDVPSHGQVPGTQAYDQRREDAVPDEVEVIPEGSLSKRASRSSFDFDRPLTPGGTTIPKMVVEKVDPLEPSYGDVPGTDAYEKRLADATPDVITQAPDTGKHRADQSKTQHIRTQSDIPIPRTIVTRADSKPAYGEVKGTPAQQMRALDAEPDDMMIERDVVGSPTLDRSINRGSQHRRRSTMDINSVAGEDDDGFGDDFDDFEEGAQAGADDEFGDFDDGVEEGNDDVPTRPIRLKPEAEEELVPTFPLIDFDALSSLADLLEATQMHLDAMFPTTTADALLSIPEPGAIPADSPIFPSERSRSLWKQLITPPPLQPPNWTKSRIRRLFLVSLGVPVDLDEILPPSKQKKLILPDVNLESSAQRSESDKATGSVARLKAKAANDSTGSIDSTQSGTKPVKRRQRGPQPPPELDLGSVRRLCATTTEKIDGLTDEELNAHVQDLQSLTEKTSELLEYWLKRRDGALKEKEAFDGVIENLVKHARRVRK